MEACTGTTTTTTAANEATAIHHGLLHPGDGRTGSVEKSMRSSTLDRSRIGSLSRFWRVGALEKLDHAGVSL